MMHSSIWCSFLVILLSFLLLVVQYGNGKTSAQEKDLEDSDGEEENESQRSEIPRHHRSREAHSRHNRRAERGRYRSVLAVGVGCAVAGGWICLATVVYVVRYLRAKKEAAARGPATENLL